MWGSPRSDDAPTIGTMAEETPKSRKKLWIIIGAVVAALLVIGGVSRALGGGSPTETPPPAAESTPPTIESPEPAAAETPADPAVAAEFAAYMATSAGGEPPSWWMPVTQVEDMPGGIRVYYQEQLTDEDRDQLAQWIRNFAAAAPDDLGERVGMIVIRDATGIDSNHR